MIVLGTARKVSKAALTWSSNKALIAIFFLLNDSVNSSTVIGSNNASGPSSDMGDTAAGYINKAIEKA